MPQKRTGLLDPEAIGALHPDARGLLDDPRAVRDRILANPSYTPRGLLEFGLSVAPITGEVLSARDAYRAFQEGDVPGMLLGALGAVPAAGMATRGVAKLSDALKLFRRKRRGVEMQFVADDAAEAAFSPPDKAGGPFRLWSPDGMQFADYDPATGKRIQTGQDRLTKPTPEQLEAWDRLATSVAQRMRDNMAAQGGAQRFIRFGPLPQGGRSRNFATGEMEKGVSVFGAKFDPLHGTFRFDEDGTEPGAIFSHLFSGSEPMLVEGRVVGRGSDGEPVIANPKVVGRLLFDPEADGFRVIPLDRQ